MKLHGWYGWYQRSTAQLVISHQYAEDVTAFEAREEAARLCGIAPQDLVLYVRPTLKAEVKRVGITYPGWRQPPLSGAQRVAGNPAHVKKQGKVAVPKSSAAR